MGAVLLAVAPVATAQEAPLSAIDWLSEAVADPVARQAETPAPIEPVDARPIGAPPRDAAGLIAPAAHGLPTDLWQGSSSRAIAAAIAAQPDNQLPAARARLYNLLLAELDPPADTSPEDRVFLARIDKLLAFGALDRAEALLEQAGPDTPAAFARWFDVSLLTGYEDRACAAMLAAPQMAPTLPARIFCLARGGDWAAAALLLDTAAALGEIAPDEADLVARFLDPEPFAGEPDLPAPERLTPLAFKMREATAQPRPARTLAPAFAWADLSPFSPWRSQLLAAERLARTGAVTPGRLMALYAGHRPAASGGLWDRVAAVQALDVALLAGDIAAVEAALPRAWQAMLGAGLAVPFARHVAPRLGAVPADGPARTALIEVTLLGPDPEAAASRFTPRTPGEAFLLGLAAGRVPNAATHPLGPSLAAGLAGAPPPGALARMMGEGRAGEALLAALARLTPSSDPAAFAEALAHLRQVGDPMLARRAALERVLLSR
jgi:hypothetical protein